MSKHPNPVRILVIDDEEPIGELVRGYLEGEGWLLDVETDGDSGLERAIAQRPTTNEICEMTEQDTTRAIDPVCGMTVDPAPARAAGLVTEHNGQTYYFCGKGCLLEFRDDPETILAPAYKPSM